MGVIIGAVVAVLLGVLGAVIVTRPSTYAVERRRRVAGDPQTVYALLSDFRNWLKWSPWEKLDPALARTYSGAESGIGAVYEWSGNSKAGQGRMEITNASPGEFVSIRLEFIKPFASVCQTTFTLSPGSDSDEGTEVVWRMEGSNNFMGKAMSLFMDMDKLVGRDFEQGLRNLEEATGAL